MDLGEAFWTERYRNGQTGWDAGVITPPLKEYFDQIKNTELSILIPGCGNAYEAEYLHKQGFTNVLLVDISMEPLRAFKNRVGDFPDDHLVYSDFFELTGSFDLIIEQTFFSALHPSKRENYVRKCKELLKPSGKLVGVLFDDPLFDDHPPYGGSKEEYLPFFTPYFHIKTFERCYNSLKQRQGRELFIQLINSD